MCFEGRNGVCQYSWRGCEGNGQEDERVAIVGNQAFMMHSVPFVMGLLFYILSRNADWYIVDWCYELHDKSGKFSEFSIFFLSNKLTPSEHKNSSSFCPAYGNHVAGACSDQWWLKMTHLLLSEPVNMMNGKLFRVWSFCEIHNFRGSKQEQDHFESFLLHIVLHELVLCCMSYLLCVQYEFGALNDRVVY